MNRQNLDFFNGLSGKLQFDLSEETKSIGNLDNQVATPTAKINGLKLTAEVYEADQGAFRNLTPDELAFVVLESPRIQMCGESEKIISHDAPNGASFSVQDLLNAVEETERRSRDDSEWFGGVDVHHCYFEGIQRRDDGVWEICWGS